MDERFSTLNGDLMTESMMLEEFNRLVQETPSLQTPELPIFEAPKAPQVKEREGFVPTQSDGTLEEMIQLFKNNKQEKLFTYLNKTQKKDNTLLFLDSFMTQDGISDRKSTGGFFFSHAGLGVVVNPGKDFLRQFHACGHNICDIDVVVVTTDRQESSQDLFAIYQLNRECNLATNQFHLIRYVLQASVFRKSASQLKPFFKQERNSVLSMDLFEERETLELSDKLRLSYSSASDESLCVMFDLQGKKLGYYSKAPFSPKAVDMLNGCEILILGFDETNHSDLTKQHCLEKSLGYTGVFNMCNELGPKLAFLTEHSGNIGDLRLELVKRLKQELADENCSTTLFPAEMGLYVDMKHLTIYGVGNHQWLNFKNTRVIQPSGPYSPLHFISSDSIL